MIDRELLARIRKCLALSASANEHEAAAALAKAKALMTENGVSDTDIAAADVEEVPASGSRTMRPPRWEQFLCAAVRRALGVECILGSDLRRRYIGRGATPEIASYAFTSLFRRLKSARASYIRTRLRRCSVARKRVRADAFCEGWAIAVLDKIKALTPVPSEDSGVKHYLTKCYPHLIEVPSRRSATGKPRVLDDANRGFIAGCDIELHNGVPGARPAILLDV